MLARAFREMTSIAKFRLQTAGFRLDRRLHAAGIRHRNPQASLEEIQRSWNRIRLGDAFSGPPGNLTMNADLDPRIVVRDVTSALDRLGIPHAVGGSWASSHHGEARSTGDADLAVEPFPGLESELVACFGPDYYVSLDAVRSAVAQRSTFNIINTSLGFKVDLFVRRDRPFERSLMHRRIRVPLDETGPPIAIVTAEDVILLKLEWYRLGGETSERQWLDVLGVIRVQAERLDLAYLQTWARELGVLDLWTEARASAG